MTRRLLLLVERLLAEAAAFTLAAKEGVDEQNRPDQALRNHESRRRQYALADRARTLGWSDLVIVDDDLGRSGDGTERPGFERLLLATCEARVGIVLAVEVSQLARNGRDWHSEMAERGELTLEETARHLKVSKMTVLRLIGSGIVRARQVCKGAPWAIHKAELAGLDPRTALIRRPQSENPDQQSFVPLFFNNVVRWAS